MEEIIPSNEYTVVDDTAYVNPQVALDEGNKFIDNYRATQAENTAKIASDTHNLGTDAPSSQGGLTGGGSYFTSRYQTPQTNAAISDIRSTIQAKALNDVLENEQNYWKGKYSDAYSAAQKRASSSSGSGSGSSGESIGETEYKDPSEETASGTASSVGAISLPAGSGNIRLVQVDDEYQYIDMDTGEVVRTDLNGNIKESKTETPTTDGALNTAGALSVKNKLFGK